MRRIGLIAGVLVLVLALFYVNAGIGRNAQPDTSDDDQSSSSQTQNQAPPAKAPPTPPSTPSPMPPAEQTLGDPATAKYKVTVGWAYNPDNQAHPEALNQALEAVRQFAGTHKNAAVQIVNVDVPVAARSPQARAVTGTGIVINGKPLAGLGADPGEEPATAGQITDALRATVPSH